MSAARFSDPQWTKAEDEVLRDGCARGHSASVMARTLGKRTTAAVRTRCRMLGLYITIRGRKNSERWDNQLPRIIDDSALGTIAPPRSVVVRQQPKPKCRVNTWGI